MLFLLLTVISFVISPNLRVYEIFKKLTNTARVSFELSRLDCSARHAMYYAMAYHAILWTFRCSPARICDVVVVCSTETSCRNALRKHTRWPRSTYVREERESSTAVYRTNFWLLSHTRIIGQKAIWICNLSKLATTGRRLSMYNVNVRKRVKSTSGQISSAADDGGDRGRTAPNYIGIYYIWTWHTHRVYTSGFSTVFPSETVLP